MILMIRSLRAAKIARSSLAIILSVFMLVPMVRAEELPNFTTLVDTVGPAVVKITIESNQAPKDLIDIPEGIPEPLKRFFEEAPGGTPFSESGIGSGFIVSEDGYIVTNAHVIDKADIIKVGLPDDREYEATVVGKDTRTDVALIKIDEKDLPFLGFGPSTSLKVGQWVLAIGSPFGIFDYSATKGIISALSREMPGDTFVPFIQTDVAVNPGNSGGPLFNLDGEVIGVNAQIYTRSGGFMGLSFAIPSNVVERVVNQLKEKGYVSRGWLGVTIQAIDEKLVEAMGLEDEHGALVTNIVKDGPSADSDLKVNDVIRRFDGVDIKSSSDLPRVVAATPVGKDVEIEVFRDGKIEEISIELGELTEEKYQALITRKSPVGDMRFGAAVEALGEDEKDAQDLEGGVRVIDVAPGSAAANAGIETGDILLRFNRVELSDDQSLDAAVEEAPADKPVAVLLLRDGARRFVTVELE